MLTGLIRVTEPDDDGAWSSNYWNKSDIKMRGGWKKNSKTFSKRLGKKSNQPMQKINNQIPKRISESFFSVEIGPL